MAKRTVMPSNRNWNMMGCEFLSCVDVEVDVGFSSLDVLYISVRMDIVSHYAVTMRCGVGSANAALQ